MIPKESILSRTGQAWKFQLTMFCLLIALVLMLYAESRIDSLTPEGFSLVMMLGVFIGLGGFFYAAVAIRCPDCGTHWFWDAVSGLRSDRWILGLFRSDCPMYLRIKEFRERAGKNRASP